MLSLARRNQYYQVFLAQGVGTGLAVGLLFLPSLSIVGHHFSARRRALATGIVVSGASCGGIVFPILLNRLIPSALGFANAVRVAGALVAALLLAANALMRTRLPARDKRLADVFSARAARRIAGDGAYVWSIAGCVPYPFLVCVRGPSDRVMRMPLRRSVRC